MTSAFGSMFEFLFGADDQRVVRSFYGPDVYAALRADQQNTYDLILEWGQVCTASFVWYPKPGHMEAVTSGKQPTPADAAAECSSRAIEAGYTSPVWWQWWRWRENPLPARGVASLLGRQS